MKSLAVTLSSAIILAASASAALAEDASAPLASSSQTAYASCRYVNLAAAEQQNAAPELSCTPASGIRRFGHVSWNVGEAWLTGPLAATVSAFNDGRDALAAPPQSQAGEENAPRP
jgi:hypothetical protein